MQCGLAQTHGCRGHGTARLKRIYWKVQHLAWAFTPWHDERPPQNPLARDGATAVWGNPVLGTR